MGAEPAQSEGAGAEKVVHYLDQFPERDQLLEHPGRTDTAPSAARCVQRMVALM